MTGTDETPSLAAAEHAARIKQREFEAAALLLSQIESDPKGGDLLALGDFARDAYRRVEDMFSRPEFESCRRMTMIGCGPLPVTVLHVAARCPHIEIDALDIDGQALAMAGRVAAAIGLAQIQFVQGDGVDHSYGQSEIVYVANLVRAKIAVLRRIAQTATDDALVILRDPTQAGTLKAEVGLDRIGDDFTLVGLGEDSDVFQSRHVFLNIARGQKRQ